MTTLLEALTVASQLYNIIFIVITLVLFWILFTTQSKSKLSSSWKILFFSFMFLVAKEVLIVLRTNEILKPELYLNGLFDLAFIVLFLYTLLRQN